MLNFEILKKEHTIAGPGFNRWLVPPAALAIHLCIGMAYGFSVFWIPLQKAIGITKPVLPPADMGLIAKIFSTSYDWNRPMVVVMYTLFFVLLGSSAAIWGGWLEHAGPRKAGLVSAFCWCGGLVISAIGVYVHQIWMLWLGSGVIGGIGLGLGYISPVSTLIKWFPDRRGMATGMAIMGFGGGAMIGSPLAERLMNYYRSATSVGVWETFLTLAVIYFIYMVAGAMSYRVPPPNWKPEGWEPPSDANKNALITNNHVHLDKAWKTPQFWCLWGVLCLNVSATIGIIGVASPMLQEIFGGRLLGLNIPYEKLDKDQLKLIATIGAGFTGLLSVFNIGGRFVWASLSDHLGRKLTYSIFFILGFVLYVSNPSFGKAGYIALFVASFCVLVSMYGGGFATIPAYLADMFGTQMVGAIHGRLLTAWSTAGVLGPVLVTNMCEYQRSKGAAHAYDLVMYILAGLLVLGFICNIVVRPVDPKHHMTEEEQNAHKLQMHKSAGKHAHASGDPASIGGASHPIKLFFAWTAVGIPIAFGFYFAINTAVKLFK
jgi:MFS family permease